VALIKRLDHIILCGRDRRKWIPNIERVLGLSPGGSREGDEWGFSNAEFDIGDGFLGLVEPAGSNSQLHRFLEHHPEGFYAVSVDVGDLAEAAGFLDQQHILFSKAMRGSEVGLLWVPPKATGGVLYQLTKAVPFASGANPEYLGFSGVTIAVEDLDAAIETYRRCFGLEPADPARDDRLGYAGASLNVPGASGGDRIVLAEPTSPTSPLGLHLAQQGPGIFQFTIAVRDLDTELSRLANTNVAFTVGNPAASGVTAWIDPAELHGVRVELHQTGS
jgi:catechol 2,3-dioxygenase-like lactoylglutathione lyase family enzyme